MGKPFSGDIISNTFGKFSIFLDLSLTGIELVVIGYTNPILDKCPKAQKFFCIKRSPEGLEHMPLAIEYVLALRECCTNHVYLCIIVICHEN